MTLIGTVMRLVVASGTASFVGGHDHGAASVIRRQ